MVNPTIVTPLSAALLSASLWMTGCEWKPPRRPALKRLTLVHEEPSAELLTAQEEPAQEEPAQEEPAQEEPAQEEPAHVSSKPAPPAERAPLTTSLSERPLPPQEGRDYLFAPPDDAEPQVYLKDLIISDRLRAKNPARDLTTASLSALERGSEELFGYMRVRNFKRPQRVTLSWVYLGGEAPEVRHTTRHKVGISPRWRTWSRLHTHRMKGRTGLWRVDVSRRAEGGDLELIGRRYFTLTP